MTPWRRLLRTTQLSGNQRRRGRAPGRRALEDAQRQPFDQTSPTNPTVLHPMREQVHRHATPATARELEIVPGVLGARGELLGALALVLAGDPVAGAAAEATPYD